MMTEKKKKQSRPTERDTNEIGIPQRKWMSKRYRRPNEATLAQKKREIFLDVLSRTGKVVQAAQAVGYTDSSYLRKVYNEDPEFAEQWDAALEAAADVLEDEAIRRATEGVMDPIYYQGKVVGHRVNYSDALLMFLLKGAKPDKFAERKKVDSNIEGKIGVALLPLTAADASAWEKQALGVHASQDANRITIDAIDAEFTEVKSGETTLKRT